MNPTPDEIQLCKECGHRVFPLSGVAEPYCYKGGHKSGTVTYVRKRQEENADEAV